MRETRKDTLKVRIGIKVIESWMFDIINNKRNSIDVDKFDYIKRDTQTMNLSFGSFDSQILLKTAMVIDQQICYPVKHNYQIQRLF